MALKETRDTHSKVIGYILWIFGFTGSHRFYYGYPMQSIVTSQVEGSFDTLRMIR